MYQEMKKIGRYGVWNDSRYMGRRGTRPGRAEMRRQDRRRRTAASPFIRVLFVLTIFFCLFFLGKGVRKIGNMLMRIKYGNASSQTAGDAQEGIRGTQGEGASAAGSRMVVYLDPGHGGKDQGTSYQEVLEKNINLTVAKKAETLLSDAGYKVVMTRTDDTKVGKYERAEMANQGNANVFVSIHCNFVEQGDADGIEIYYDSQDTEGGVLAKRILGRMTKMTGARDRGVRTEDFVVTRETDMPSVLVELGYLSDRTERGKLMSDNYQNLLAVGIAGGIREFLEGIK